MDLTDSVQALVLETLKTTCKVDRAIMLETDLGDIGFDSLVLSAIVIRAESHYGVELTHAHILEMFQSTLVADLAQAITAAILEYRASRSTNM